MTVISARSRFLRGRPRALDLFSGAGGAGTGYHRAGFEVVGVDINPQPNYPFEFVQGDALEYLEENGHLFDFIHASPPCQGYTGLAAQKGTQDRHPRMITATREVVSRFGVPHVIENVEGARSDMIDPVMLCGTMFGLGLYRHRLFEGNIDIDQPQHNTPHPGRIGDGKYVTMVGNTGGKSKRDKIQHGSKSDWQTASHIDWMTVAEMREAIPPAYTEHLGAMVMRHLDGLKIAA